MSHKSNDFKGDNSVVHSQWYTSTPSVKIQNISIGPE